MIANKFWKNAEKAIGCVEYVPTDRRRAVLQAGGHLGAVPLLLANRFARVVTYEVARDNFDALAWNVGTTPNVEIHHGALGDGRPVNLARGKYTATHQVISSKMGDLPCFRIDDVAPPELDLLMLDVEGHELTALQWATRTLRAQRPVVVAEENRMMARYGRQPGDLERFLSEFGYTLADKNGDDLIFLP